MVVLLTVLPVVSWKQLFHTSLSFPVSEKHHMNISSLRSVQLEFIWHWNRAPVSHEIFWKPVSDCTGTPTVFHLLLTSSRMSDHFRQSCQRPLRGGPNAWSVKSSAYGRPRHSKDLTSHHSDVQLLSISRNLRGLMIAHRVRDDQSGHNKFIVSVRHPQPPDDDSDEDETCLSKHVRYV